MKIVLIDPSYPRERKDKRTIFIRNEEESKSRDRKKRRSLPVIEEDRLCATSKSFFQSKMKNLSMSIWWLRGNILCYEANDRFNRFKSMTRATMIQRRMGHWVDGSQCVSVFVDPLNTRVMRIFYFRQYTYLCVYVSFILVSFSFKKYERECFRYQAFLLFFFSFFVIVYAAITDFENFSSAFLLYVYTRKYRYPLAKISIDIESR